MKIYTDRFETTLPPEVRERFRFKDIPHTPVGVSSTPTRTSAGKKTPWVLLAWSTIVLILGAIFLVTYEQIRTHGIPQEALTSPRHADPPLMPIGVPAILQPTPRSEPAFVMPAPTPEVRRAVPNVMLGRMPDGSLAQIWILGERNSQEELPLTGNNFGDAYKISGIPFVWTRLTNGQGAWIDPEIIP
jgi:hypothetical protein